MHAIEARIAEIEKQLHHLPLYGGGDGGRRVADLVTERRRAERELHAAMERWSAATEALRGV